MSDQDNLRDRIASVVAERNAYFGGHTGRADPAAVAQAIIDEFGLTVETVDPHRDKFTEAERKLYGIRAESRVVGKWEKQ